MGYLIALIHYVLMQMCLFMKTCVFVFRRKLTTSSSKRNDEALDPFQESLLKEQCILVNENDQELGSASKRHSGRFHAVFLPN